MKKNLGEVAVELATSLIAAAGFAQAVAATDIRSAVRNLNSQGDSYPQSQLEERVKSEIQKRHTPGVSGKP